MSRVQITGLNNRQRAIADVLWMMQDRSQVEAFVRALHPSMRKEAETVVELMMWAIWDDIDTVEESTKIIIDNLK